jgi:hypothetical protein
LSCDIALQESGQREIGESFHSEFRFFEKNNRRANYRFGERGLRIGFSRFDYSALFQPFGEPLQQRVRDLKVAKHSAAAIFRPVPGLDQCRRLPTAHAVGL